MSARLPFALHDCFSGAAFSGNQAAVVSDAAGFDAMARERIAREFGFPATALGGDLNMVDVYHALGVREMLVAYNLNNEAGRAP